MMTADIKVADYFVFAVNRPVFPAVLNPIIKVGKKCKRRKYS